MSLFKLGEPLRRKRRQDLIPAKCKSPGYHQFVRVVDVKHAYARLEKVFASSKFTQTVLTFVLPRYEYVSGEKFRLL